MRRSHLLPALVSVFASFFVSLAASAQSAPQNRADSRLGRGTIEADEGTSAGAPLAPLTPTQAIILGLVEGVTEFLPVSSTGHLILANRALSLDSEEPLRDAQGRPLWHTPPTASLAEPDMCAAPNTPDGKVETGEPLTIKLAADTYTVVIQGGAILAVLSLYWPSCLAMLRGLFGCDRAGLLLFRNLCLAFVPVALVGLLASDLIEAYLFSVTAVLIGLVGGAVLMLLAERWRRAQSPTPLSSLTAEAEKQPAALSVRDALKIGAIQCLALWPGASRSMLTIVGGYWAGLSPAKAAEFSFLVGLPVLAGAAILKSLRSGPEMLAVFGAPSVLLGMAVAAVSAAFAVKFLVKILTRYGLSGFALYRLVLAATVAAVIYL